MLKNVIILQLFLLTYFNATLQLLFLIFIFSSLPSTKIAGRDCVL